MSWWPLAGAALLLGACGSDLASPFGAVAITYDVQKQAFKLAQVRVNTLTSLRHLKGTAGEVRAGGSVRVRRAAVNAGGATVASLRAAIPGRWYRWCKSLAMRPQAKLFIHMALSVIPGISAGLEGS